jgi:hypothetical protein
MEVLYQLSYLGEVVAPILEILPGRARARPDSDQLNREGSTRQYLNSKSST